MTLEIRKPGEGVGDLLRDVFAEVIPCPGLCWRWRREERQGSGSQCHSRTYLGRELSTPQRMPLRAVQPAMAAQSCGLARVGRDGPAMRAAAGPCDARAH